MCAGARQRRAAMPLKTVQQAGGSSLHKVPALMAEE